MDASGLADLGKIAGLGGLALGVFLIIFRDFLRLSIFPRLSDKSAHSLLRTATLCCWSIAIIGVAAWLYSERLSTSSDVTNQATTINGNNNNTTQTTTFHKNQERSKTDQKTNITGEGNLVHQEKIE